MVGRRWHDGWWHIRKNTFRLNDFSQQNPRGGVWSYNPAYDPNKRYILDNCLVDRGQLVDKDATDRLLYAKLSCQHSGGAWRLDRELH